MSPCRDTGADDPRGQCTLRPMAFMLVFNGPAGVGTPHPGLTATDRQRIASWLPKPYPRQRFFVNCSAMSRTPESCSGSRAMNLITLTPDSGMRAWQGRRHSLLSMLTATGAGASSIQITPGIAWLGPSILAKFLQSKSTTTIVTAPTIAGRIFGPPPKAVTCGTRGWPGQIPPATLAYHGARRLAHGSPPSATLDCRNTWAAFPQRPQPFAHDGPPRVTLVTTHVTAFPNR
jgi:hypothetical protein